MLSELRNKVVHDVKEIGFSLPNYVSGLNASQRRQFRVKAMHWIEEEELGVYTDLCQDQPRMILWLATSALAVRGVDRLLGDKLRRASQQAIAALVARTTVSGR